MALSATSILYATHTIHTLIIDTSTTTSTLHSTVSQSLSLVSLSLAYGYSNK